MIFRKSKLIVADNTGAKVVQCIGFRRATLNRCVGTNHLIRVCVKKFRSQRRKLKKVFKKLKYWALILSCRSRFHRRDGSFVRSKYNRVMMLDFKFKFLGTGRVGPVTKELRKRRRRAFWRELLSYAGGTF